MKFFRLERHYPFAAINLYKDLNLDDYVTYFSEKDIRDRGGNALPPLVLPASNQAPLLLFSALYIAARVLSTLTL